MRTGFFQKRGIPVKKEEIPYTPFKMQQILTYWVKPETIYFSKLWSKKRKGNPLKRGRFSSLSKGWDEKHRLSEHVMADISHVFLFL